RLRDQCIWGVANIAADCVECKQAVRATGVLDVIANQMYIGEFHSAESTRCAIWCCLNILRGANVDLTTKTARMLLTAITKTMRRFEWNEDILKDSLLTLSMLADDRNFSHHPRAWSEQIDAMLDEPGLVPATLAAIDTGNSAIVSPALRFIGNIITGTDEQTERVVMREGFVQLVGRYLGSSTSQVRREAAWILSNIAAGPAHHLDMILTNSSLIVMLLHSLHHDDIRMKKEVCWLIANCLSSLTTEPRPEKLSDFLGYGVLAIVDFATKSCNDTRLIGKIREVLSSLLIVHPEFWPVVERAGAGATPLLEVPRRKRRVADYVIYNEEAMEI
ncbi:hypothetical protein PMAYCL1PPCAC_05598, partial [Pristionchus mayeri]